MSLFKAVKPNGSFGQDLYLPVLFSLPLDSLTGLATQASTPHYTSSVCPSQGCRLISCHQGSVGQRRSPRVRKPDGAEEPQRERQSCILFFKGNLPPKPGCLASTHSLSLQDVAAVTGLFIAVDLIFFFPQENLTQRERGHRKVLSVFLLQAPHGQFKVMKNGNTG